MPVLKFPPQESADSDGLLALGGDLHPESLLLAYRQGIFPWPIEGLPLAWFAPPERAVLFFDRLHIGRSLARARKKSTLRVSFDQAFGEVIQLCASVRRPDQPEAGGGTWITPEMIEAYRNLHALGHAHSVEVWQESHLVGGVYGVDAGGAFSPESMFHLQPWASKLALLALIEHLQARGAAWLDVQVLSPHLEALGTTLIPRAVFRSLLDQELSRGLNLFARLADSADPAGQAGSPPPLPPGRPT